MWVDLLKRELPPDEAELRGELRDEELYGGGCLTAIRTFEIAELDQGDGRVVRAENVVGGADKRWCVGRHADTLRWSRHFASAHSTASGRLVIVSSSRFAAESFMGYVRGSTPTQPWVTNLGHCHELQ